MIIREGLLRLVTILYIHVLWGIRTKINANMMLNYTFSEKAKTLETL